MTIYDIAKEAGVAASTVSRVINHKPGIKAETRERVEALLKKYNYTPDANARGLVMQSSKTIGILIVDFRVSHHTEGAFFIERAMAERGYFCMTFTTGPAEENMDKYLQQLRQHRVEGVVLIGSTFVSEAVKKSISTYLPDVPVVIVNGSLDLPNVIGVIADEKDGIRECVHLLHAKGKKKIAFAADQQYTIATRKKLDGYRIGIHETGLEEQYVYTSHSNTVDGGYEITKEILTEHPDVDGIIYVIDILGAGGVRAAVDLGYSIPEQLSLIGVDNCVYGEICTPRLSSLDNKQRDISRLAAKLLIDALDGNVETREIKERCEIVERETT